MAAKGRFTIVSGGQTGVDRVALDFAVANGVQYYGFVPPNRAAEDGRVPDKYVNLREMERLPGENPADSYRRRTRLNVHIADGTLLFANSLPLEGGTKLAYDCAIGSKKPVLVVTYRPACGVLAAAATLEEFVLTNDIRILNVGGPRDSKQPCGDVNKFAKFVLLAWWASTQIQK